MVGDVDGVVTTIATAVEEPSVTTSEISSNVAEASQGIQEISQNVAQSSSVINPISHDVDGLNHTAKVSADGLANIDSSTTELHRLSEDLTGLVVRLRV